MLPTSDTAQRWPLTHTENDMPCSLCTDPARCDRAGLCQEFKAAPPDRRTLVTQDQHKLENCPFCGYEAAINSCTTTDREFIEMNGRDTGYGVNCIRCGVNNRGIAVGYATKEEAVAAWNRRAHLQQRPLPVREGTEIHRLRDALRSAQRAINSMKVEAETGAVIGDEEGMLDACNTISQEGLEADTEIRAVLGALTLPAVPAMVPPGQVVAWMWQHKETGNVGFIDQWQIDNGWQAANPRLRLIRPLVFASSPSVQNMGEGETGKDGLTTGFRSVGKVDCHISADLDLVIGTELFIRAPGVKEDLK